MKGGVFLILLCSVFFVNAQNPINYYEIDRNVCCIEALKSEELARKLTFSYHTDIEKVRAIFSWIAQHITYRTRIRNKYSFFNNIHGNSDSNQDWKSADEMTADMVLKSRTAVCDGYSKLFKTLCSYADIKSEVINGFARGDNRRSNSRFNSNHTWNAVFLDGKWQLIDVTWGSGYLTYSDEFIQSIDENYFLTSPGNFISDHYPEDLKWSLLEHPPALYEFQHSPFKYKSFVKYGINSYLPSKGIINATVGDTLHFELELRDVQKSRNISPDPFFDPSDSLSFLLSGLLKPDKLIGNKVEYVYVLGVDKLEWINLLYNDDPVLRYRINVLGK
ncbi:MAG TPA: transglutaminase domain-containing protein [Flavisolibacter sp.]|nr:transglutaminase domain-containing protein [Flavisolibacter sp.]